MHQKMLKLRFTRELFLVSFTFLGFNFEHLVDAKGPPSISTHDPRYNVRVGDFLRLVCPVTSDPPSLFAWIKDGRPIHVGWEGVKMNDNYLKIKETSRGDRGVYVCSATNGFGTVEVRLIVNVTPYNGTETQLLEDIDDKVASPIFDKKEGGSSADVTIGDRPSFLQPYPEDVTVWHGEMASFHCRVKFSSDDKPLIQWFKRRNGSHIDTQFQEIHYSSNMTLSSSDWLIVRHNSSLTRLDQTTHVSSLRILSVTSREAGQYACACASGYRMAYLFVKHDDRIIFGTSLFPIVSAIVVVVCLLLLAVLVCTVHKWKHNRQHGSAADERSRVRSEKTTNGAAQYAMYQPVPMSHVQRYLKPIAPSPSHILHNEPHQGCSPLLDAQSASGSPYSLVPQGKIDLHGIEELQGSLRNTVLYIPRSSDRAQVCRKQDYISQCCPCHALRADEYVTCTYSTAKHRNEMQRVQTVANNYCNWSNVPMKNNGTNFNCRSTTSFESLVLSPTYDTSRLTS